MKANIDLKVTGVRGGNPSWTENKGQVVVFVDDDKNVISIDAFIGQGSTYKKREVSLIEIRENNGEMIFLGTFDDLVKTLKS